MSDIVYVAGREILDSRGNPTVEVEVVLSSGAHGPRRRAERCVDRRARGGRAARRRRPLRRQGRADRGRLRQRRDRRRARGVRRPRPARASTASCSTSTAPTTRAGSAPTRSSARQLAVAKAAADRARAPAVPLRRRQQRPRPAGADDERAQRRRARRQHGRLPGVHDHAGRRAVVQRGAALGHRDVPRAQEGAARQGAVDGASATRAGSRPTSPPTRTRSSCSSRRSSKAGYTPGDDIAIALDPAVSELYRDGAYHLDGEGKVLSSDDLAAYWTRIVDTYPIVSIEDGMQEDDWDGWKLLTDADRRPLPARRRRPVRHQRPPAADGDRARRRQLDPGQGQPDRLADRDARHRRVWRRSTRTRR